MKCNLHKEFRPPAESHGAQPAGLLSGKLRMPAAKLVEAHK
jgi:hypothetical protein